MKIFIESRVCEELKIDYNNFDKEYTIETEDFVEAWNLLCVSKEWITTDNPPENLNFSRMLFSTFIENHKSNKMNLINRGSGYFELK